jgi:hypothetical protein
MLGFCKYSFSNKQVKRFFILSTTFVYILFACLYVVACTKLRAAKADKVLFAALTKSAKKESKGHQTFLSRPRVVNNRAVDLLLVPALISCIAFLNCSLPQLQFAPIHCPVFYQSSPLIIFLRQMRI